MELLSFKPIYQDRVWGGDNLRTRLGRELPHTGPIGEAWEIVDRPEAQSVCNQTGKTLAQWMQASAADIMGPAWAKTRNQPFPILVKWLDCQDRLSLQVHPPANLAEQLGGEPKTECWYITEATAQAGLYVGLKKGTTRSQFESVLREEGGAGLQSLIHHAPVKRGESILLESGRIHAIDAGNLILEIQQNSDTTYRVYDWGRVGLDGKPRQLHIEQSLSAIDFDDFEPEIVHADFEAPQRILADSPLFRIQQFNLKAGESLSIQSHQSPSIVSLVEGTVVSLSDHSGQRQTLQRGANVLCPYVWGGQFKATCDATILLTDNF